MKNKNLKDLIDKPSFIECYNKHLKELIHRFMVIVIKDWYVVDHLCQFLPPITSLVLKRASQLLLDGFSTA